MNVASCSFCRGQGGCTLSLTRPHWGGVFDSARVVSFAKGRLVYRQGSVARGVCLLCQGSLKLTVTTENGGERITGLVTCGELFGLDALLSDPVRWTSAIAREDSQAILIEKVVFKKSIQQNSDLAWNVMLALNELLHRANYEKLMVSGARVRDRILHVLMDLADRLKKSQIAGKPRFLLLKQRELAELLGVPEETICRELRKVRAEQGAQRLAIGHRMPPRETRAS